MGKISKALRAAGLILRRPWLLNLILDSEAAWKDRVHKEYGFENGLPCVPFRHFLGGQTVEIKPYGFLDGGSLVSDLALLKLLAQRYQVKDYLEIGTWRGESVANVASVVEHCITVNLPDSEMQNMGLDEDYIRMHRHFSEHLPNVTHLQAHSHHFDFASLNQKFDMIFIDGDHHSESIAKDTAIAFGLLKDERSIIVWHDYALSPETPRYEVLSGILAACPADERKHLYHIGNTICAVYCRESLPAGPLKVNDHNAEAYTVSIKG